MKKLSNESFNKVNDFQVQTGYFRNLCEFVRYGAIYMDQDVGAQERLFAMLDYIAREAKRIEDMSDEIFADMAKHHIWG